MPARPRTPPAPRARSTRSTRSAPITPSSPTSPIDAYIAGFPDHVQSRLEALRQTIRRAAPDATETMAYRIPTFTLHGNLVHFGGFRDHIGFYPGPSGLSAFSSELAGFAGAKGSVRFPHDTRLPLGVVTRIVKFRVRENLARHTRPTRASRQR